jgi:serine/threonine protein kinase
MDPERWRRVEELYHSALRIPPPQRAEFLSSACKDDIELRKEVESLLTFSDSTATFFEQRGLDVAAKALVSDSGDDNQLDSPPPGSLVGRFRIVEKIGGGGMGIVYKAEDTKLQRVVALKFLPPELAEDAHAIGRFRIEAHAASALNHPHICTIYDIDDSTGQPFIAMEFLDGTTLEQRIGGKPMPADELFTLALQMASALEAAHARGIVHRDIKPSNIFVTSNNQAKVLDFGLAKLQAGDSSDAPSRMEPAHEHPQSRDDHRLSFTGAVFGTAGYMSPEQVRGEKLDARTDIFSFGLVLYEMATGHRAFRGTTRGELLDAILEQNPPSIRAANSKLPSELGKIVVKAIEKDRNKRFQSISELAADLNTLHRRMFPHSRTARRMAAVASALLLVAVVFAVWVARRKPPSQTPPEFRQLTINSPENRITSGVISPDDKYLAYVDSKRVYLKDLQTGNARMVPLPNAPGIESMQWEVGPWFPDSTKFTANTHPTSTTPPAALQGADAMWVVPRSGGVPTKLRENAVVFDISSDGSQVAFGQNVGKFGPSELWSMSADATGAHRLYDPDENSALCCLRWSPDRQRIIYVKTDSSGDTFLSRDLKGGAPSILLQPPETKKVRDYLWLPDGRFLYVVEETNSFLGSKCNFWMMRVDPHSGQISQPASQLTHGGESCMNSMSATRDGKKVSFVRWNSHLASYVADLSVDGMSVLRQTRFPKSESSDGVGAWTPDGKGVIFVSNRTGTFGVYKQALDSDVAETIVSSASGLIHVSPDGKWLFFRGPMGDPSPWLVPMPIFRVPISGGTPERLFTAKAEALISCSNASLCAIAEPTEDLKHVIVSVLDVFTGRGRELMRFEMDPVKNDWWFDVSPDGTRIASTASSDAPIRVASLRGQLTQEIRLKLQNPLLGFVWSPDSKSFFGVEDAREDRILLRADLKGNIHRLWAYEGGTGETQAFPSPDGRHVAVEHWTTSGNIWTISNF